MSEQYDVDTLLELLREVPAQAVAQLRPRERGCGVCDALWDLTFKDQNPAARKLWVWHEASSPEEHQLLFGPIGALISTREDWAVLGEAVQPLFGTLVGTRCQLLYGAARLLEQITHENQPFSGENMISDEQKFLVLVRQYKHIGYGRMMQLVSHEWYRQDPIGALTAEGPCYGQLKGERNKG